MQDERNYPQGMQVTDGGVNANRVGQNAEAQRPIINMSLEVSADLPFPAALGAALRGHRITRRGWNAAGQWVAAQRPDRNSKMTAPYLYLCNAKGELVPWAPSQGDLFAQDWAAIPIQPVSGG